MTSLEDVVNERKNNGKDDLYLLLRTDSIGHSTVAERISNIIGVSVSEAAVRRYRKKAGIVYSNPNLVPTTVSEEVTTSDDTEYLRKEVIRLGKALEKEKTVNNQYEQAVYQVVSDAVDSWGLLFTPTASPNVGTTGVGDEEVAVALVSDLQLAKVSRKGSQILYDSDIAAERMDRYADKIIDITNVQRQDHEVNKIVVPVLGDIIEGEEIFPGQMWLIDSGLYRQITVNGPRIFKNFFDKLLGTLMR
jgi:hypothetical protein